MLTVAYTVLDGEILGETTASGHRDYLVDPLGSVIGMIDSSQTISEPREFWPYGQQASGTAPAVGALTFVGAQGYMVDHAGFYVRMRYYRDEIGAWMSLDSLWPVEPAYSYCNCMPNIYIDPSGMQFGNDVLDRWGHDMENSLRRGWEKWCNAFKTCGDCASQLLVSAGIDNRTHDCHHGFTHCMTCCVLADNFGDNCAIDMQNLQNAMQFWKDKLVHAERMKQCKSGLGKPASQSCDSYCRAKHGTPNRKPSCADQVYPGSFYIPDGCKTK